jgi:hypothetical protein
MPSRIIDPSVAIDAAVVADPPIPGRFAGRMLHARDCTHPKCNDGCNTARN